MRPIIKVENLSKLFRISPAEKGSARPTLKEALTDFLYAPLRHLKPETDADKELIWAIRDLNFEIMPGETIGIIGPNGSGKSTLLKILSRIIEPTSGRVEIYGRVSSLLEVGTGFHPDLTGRENIFLNGAILGMRRSEINEKFDEIVQFSEIDMFIDTPVKHYSNGMYLRLAFSVAAHLEPEVLILDEVLAVGDANFQKKCLAKMRDVTRNGRTVLLVTHQPNFVNEFCKKGILLYKGNIKKMGLAHEVSEFYNQMNGLTA